MWIEPWVWEELSKAKGKESQFGRICYAAGLGGYSVLGTLGRTRVQFTHQGASD